MTEIGEAYRQLRDKWYKFSIVSNLYKTTININSTRISHVSVHGTVMVCFYDGRILRFGWVGWVGKMAFVVEYDRYIEKCDTLEFTIDELWEIYNILINHDVEQLIIP